MNKTKLTLSLNKTELIVGWIYLALWYLVLPLVAAGICILIGLRSVAAVNLIYNGMNFVCCCLIFRRMLLESFDHIRQNRKSLINALVPGFGAYLLSAYVTGMLIMLLKPDFTNANDAVVHSMVEEFPLLIPLAVIVLVPIAEECLFRGLLFVPLCRKNRILGYAVTVVVFSAIHIVGYLDSYDAVSLLICVMQYAPGAAVLCWACESSDSLVPPILIHMTINTIGILFAR